MACLQVFQSAFSTNEIFIFEIFKHESQEEILNLHNGGSEDYLALII